MTTTLQGCAPTPLASYLKALGIFKIANQIAGAVRARWQGNLFSLEGNIPDLLELILNEYRPSPVLAPWNGGSGFYPKDNSESLKALQTSRAERFENYRVAIEAARNAIAKLSLKQKPEQDAKARLLLECRNSFPDDALEWLDSAFVLTGDGPKYPPLLGTGGNDGRLEFTNNFMQRLIEVIDPQTGKPRPEAKALLANSLFDLPIKGLEDSPIGQFNPAASGGANASTGFGAKSAVNPWDYVFSIEGAMLFAAGAVKKLESLSPGQLVYPFCVQPSGVGYSSASAQDEDEARCEIWMPLWKNPCTVHELRALLSEGRAWVGRRPAKNGIDFARAAVSLGVDRGISEFQRYGFHARNGLAYFATPLQRLKVHRDELISDLLSACDGWLTAFLGRKKDEHAPSSIKRAAKALENAILAQASSTQPNADTAQAILLALGDCERGIARSEKWRIEAFIRPVPPLSPHWVSAADNGSIEYRLAVAAASASLWIKNVYRPLRVHLEPVEIGVGERPWAAWDDEAKSEVVSADAPLVDMLCAVMRRRFFLAQSSGSLGWPEFAKVTAWPSDIAAFVGGRIDDDLFRRLLWAASLIDFSKEVDRQSLPNQPHDGLRGEDPPGFYAQLKLCFSANLPEEKNVPVEPIIFNLAASGDGARASQQALRRLHGSNIPIRHLHIPVSGETARRSAAALLFPLWKDQLRSIGRIVGDEKFFADQNL
jgi:CRISPR-associated protein Csx17